MQRFDGFQTTDSFRFDRNTSSSSISLSSSSGYGSRLSLSPTADQISISRRPGLTKYFKEKLSRHKSLASLLLFSTPTVSNNDIYDDVWNLDEQITKLQIAVQKQLTSTSQSIISMSVDDEPSTTTERKDEQDLLAAAAWYQEGLSKEICEEYFRDTEQPIGSFLIRSACNQSSFVLSLKTHRTSSEHFTIERTNTPAQTYRIQGSSKTFVNLSTLVIHHTVIQENLPVRLVLPVISSTLKYREQSSSSAVLRSVRF